MSCGPATPTPRRSGIWPGLRDTFHAGPRLAITAVLVTCGTRAALVATGILVLTRPHNVPKTMEEVGYAGSVVA